MGAFAGWEMPLFYRSAIHEHKAVREWMGLFDLSHMQRIRIEGEGARALLEYLSTTPLTHAVTYTTWCQPDGGTLDDLLVYRLDDTHWFVVANASNREKDLSHLLSYAPHFKNVKVTPCEEVILALQGPQAIQRPPMQIWEKEGVLFSSTGYTGAGGIELYASPEKGVQLWEKYLTKGAEPCGLVARDSLRLEMGYALYGHELSSTISPLESVAAWTVHLEKSFLGKEALFKQRTACGAVLEEGIPRAECPVWFQGQKIGEVTSGGYSPRLEKGIALLLLVGEIHSQVEIEIRGRKIPANILTPPFISHEKIHRHP